MNSIANEIVAIEMEVWERNWKELRRECQQSGIPSNTYYARLRKLRENVYRDIVAIESEA